MPTDYKNVPSPLELGRLVDPKVRRLEFRRLLDLVADPMAVDVEVWGVPQDGHLLKSPGSFRDQVHRHFAQGEQCQGVKMPAKKTHGLLQFREHETSVWYGWKKSFKSVFLNEQCTYWACCGVPVGMASFEMPAHKLAALAVRQALATEQPTTEQIDLAIDRLSESMVIYDVMGKVAPNHMLAVMRYCAVELGIKQFVLDNLTTLLPVGNDHFDLHQNFVTGVLAIDRSTGMHTHLVAHCAKPEKGDVSKPPGSYMIRGTGAVPDMVDNLIGVWRNTPKEDGLDDPKASTDKVERLRKEPDLLITVDNQRNWEFRGPLRYWIDRRLLRFREGGYTECEPFL